MKKLMILALGMGIALGTVSFAQDAPKTDAPKTDKKAKKAKKPKKDATKMDDSKKM